MPDDAVTEERLIQEGRPFHIIIATAADTVPVTFDLDTNTYDGTAGYFSDLPSDWNHKRDMMLWVSGIYIYPFNWFGVIHPGNARPPVIDALRFDDNAVWFGDLNFYVNVGTAQHLRIPGVSDNMNQNLLGGIYSEVADVHTKYGVKFLPVRKLISIRQQDAGTDAAKPAVPYYSIVELWGVYTPRTA